MERERERILHKVEKQKSAFIIEDLAPYTLGPLGNFVGPHSQKLTKFSKVYIFYSVKASATGRSSRS